MIAAGVAAGKKVVRVHTGDPSIYGAIREQMDCLEAMGIPFDVVPGVSSFTASASVLKKEFTLPDVSQTVICTRLEGRTPVPEKEQLESLAAHRASTMILFDAFITTSLFKTGHSIKKLVPKAANPRAKTSRKYLELRRRLALRPQPRG